MISAKASISELRITPLKAGRSEIVDSIRVEDKLVLDRSYMLVEAEPHTQTLYRKGREAPAGTFLSQREDPKLTRLQSSLTDHGLWLARNSRDMITAPPREDIEENRIPVSVWGWRGEAVDQGDEAAGWASDFIGRSVRLVRASGERPRYVTNDPRLGKVGFADGYPVTIATTYSYQKLNEQLERQGDQTIDYERMRTTIVLDDIVPSDLELPNTEFPEDYIETVSFASGGLSLVLRRAKACARCPVPDTDQQTGERQRRKPILQALYNLGRHGTHIDSERFDRDPGVYFSQNFVVDPSSRLDAQPFVISSNTEIAVEASDKTNWKSSR